MCCTVAAACDRGRLRRATPELFQIGIFRPKIFAVLRRAPAFRRRMPDRASRLAKRGCVAKAYVSSACSSVGIQIVLPHFRQHWCGMFLPEKAIPNITRRKARNLAVRTKRKLKCGAADEIGNTVGRKKSQRWQAMWPSFVRRCVSTSRSPGLRARASVHRRWLTYRF